MRIDRFTVLGKTNPLAVLQVGSALQEAFGGGYGGKIVIKFKGSHIFPTLHCVYLHAVFSKDMKICNCLCAVYLGRMGVLDLTEFQIRSNLRISFRGNLISEQYFEEWFL